ncbi:hypothetical protein L596_026544 [Steinernema carpocapsae]|uniref:Uncharacterized protein n=1 Tax=Steinernema carpocapsae TaxID=34508 RepID=A0A4U5M1P1_STECR|nr:hypothetical protein L596_026544 [Steinernema carpocapsae]
MRGLQNGVVPSSTLGSIFANSLLLLWFLLLVSCDQLCTCLVFVAGLAASLGSAPVDCPKALACRCTALWALSITRPRAFYRRGRARKAEDTHRFEQ